MSENMKAVAIVLGRKAAANAAFVAAIDSGIAAKEETQKGALHMYLKAVALFGAEMSKFPEPDSTAKDSNYPAKYPIYVSDPKTGESKETTGDFYFDLFETMPQGVRITKEIEGIDLAVAGGKAGPIPEQYEGWTNVQLSSQRKRLVGQRTTGRGLLKRTFKLAFQQSAVAALPGVIVELVMDKDKDGKETVSNSTYPIAVFNKEKVTDFRTLSVSSFLSLKPKVALDKGGTFAALIGTMGRNANDPALGIKVDAKNVESVIAGLAHFAEANIGLIAKAVNTKEAKDSDDLVLSLHDMVHALQPILAATKNRYDGLVLAQSAADDAAKAKAA